MWDTDDFSLVLIIVTILHIIVAATVLEFINPTRTRLAWRRSRLLNVNKVNHRQRKQKRPKNLKDKQVRGKVLQRAGTVLAHLGKFSLYAYAATNASTTINTL